MTLLATIRWHNVLTTFSGVMISSLISVEGQVSIGSPFLMIFLDADGALEKLVVFSPLFVLSF